MVFLPAKSEAGPNIAEPDVQTGMSGDYGNQVTAHATDNGSDATLAPKRVKTTTFKLLSFNIQCLNNKIGLLEILLLERNPDIVCISEHWMCSEEITATRLQGYEAISVFCRQHRNHGGTVIYVKSELSSQCKNLEVYTRISVNFTFECTAISFKERSVILCIYRSQVGDVDAFFAHLSDIVRDIVKRGFVNIILCGDFNINNLVQSIDRTYLFDVFESHCLRSLINEPTRVAHRIDGVVTTSGLDYVVTNIPEDDVVSCQNFQPGFSDHHAQLLVWAMESDPVSTARPVKVTYNTRRINQVSIAEFKRLFMTCDFLSLDLDDNDPDQFFNVFWNHLLWCFSAAFPLKTIHKYVNASSEHAFRFSGALRNKMTDLRDLRLLCGLLESEILTELYRAKKNEITQLVNYEKTVFYSNLINNSSNKFKTTWQLIKGNKRTHKTIEIKHNGQLVQDNKQLAKIFGDHFSSVVYDRLHDHFKGSLSQQCTVSINAVAESFFIAPVVAGDVLLVINSLPNKCSTGLDEIPTHFVKSCSDVLSPVIAEAFNQSIIHGKFPDPLKVAVVIPVPKKGSTHSITNFRPIALLSIVSKIFEKIMVDKLNVFLDKHHVLGRFQHGFRRGHSTESALVNLIQHVNDACDKNEFVVLVSFDLSRAFDTLHPPFVSDKVARVGLRGRINDWILSFLTHRTFFTKVNNVKSESYRSDLGTPQGSVLGPLIFLLYINDLPDHLCGGEIFAYADDITLVVSGADLDGVCRRINRVVCDFKLWCEKNRLIINFEKTQIMKFRSRLHRRTPFASMPIPTQANSTFIYSESVNFLGTMLDSDLTWQQHVDGVASKLNSAYYAIGCLKNKFNRETLITAYYGIFYPHLSYAILVWGLSPHSHRLFILQKRVMRLIFDIKQRETCKESFKNNNILTMVCIYIYKTLTFIHSNQSGFETRADVHNYNTRHSNLLCLSQHNHSYFERSPVYSGIKLYNTLPLGLRQLPVSRAFKSRLKKFLGRHAFYSVPDFVEGVSKYASELI